MPITIEELKQKFPIKNVHPYGECIIVPGAEFDPDWDQELLDQGVECHAEGEFVYVVLPNAEVNQGSVEKVEKKEKKTLRDELLAKSWQPEEDDLLIKLWNLNHTASEITAIFATSGTTKGLSFSKRNLGAVTNRIHRLVKQGKIKGRWVKGGKKGAEKVKEKGEKTPHTETIPLECFGHANTLDACLQCPDNRECAAITCSKTSMPPTPAPAPKVEVVASQPKINTTFTIQFNVNCSDSDAVANLFEILKKIDFRQKAASP